MNRRRLIIFVAGSLLFGMFALFALGVSQIGDCFDVTECVASKRHDAQVVLIGSAVLYFIGIVLLTWHWSRR